jgi:hypothetical protein
MRYILSLNEYRNQLEIPFLKSQHPIHDKPTHVHIIDRLEELSNELKIKSETFTSDWDRQDIIKAWENEENNAFTYFKDADIDSETIQYQFNAGFLEKYSPLDNPEYYNDEINNYIKEHPKSTLKDITEEFKLLYDLQDFLIKDNPDLEKIDNDIKIDIFYEKLQENNVLDILIDEQDENGLIPIYRAVSYSKGGFVDAYTQFKNFNGVGLFWSYKEEGAEPHSGSREDCYVLYGKIKPENINWDATVYKSAWNLNYEKEVEVEGGSPILIYKITKYGSDEGITLKKPLVVSV